MIGEWDGYDCLLLEMPHQNIPMGIEHMLEWLGRQQVRVVIAHPERNKELMAYRRESSHWWNGAHCCR